MKLILTSFFLLAALTTCTYQRACAQVVQPVDTSISPIRDTVVKYKIVYSADFDVIIKRNGDIIYGLVKEVGLELIKYQRTDIPNGPIYTIPRFEVYAISYRNQVRDILAPVVDPALIRPPGYIDYNTPGGRYYDRRGSFLSRNGSAQLGLGFIRGFSKVKNANDYSSSASFPVVTIAYDALYKGPVRLGMQLAFGSHKFSGQGYNDYDSTQSTVSIKENVFTIHVYAKYILLNTSSAFQPYALLGLGLNTANIRTNQEVNFVNRADKVLLINSGARAVGLGILARIGTEYNLNNRLRVFGDVGAGPAIINLGIAAGVK
ncbi:MAG: outer membrane beta-barrel protein [Williamsia sp.]|nr:outer membrane beta-barrel protein [Williamsia sp.]